MQRDITIPDSPVVDSPHLAPLPPSATDAPAPNRLVAIDLARALAVVMMVQGHSLHVLLAPAHSQGALFETWLWIRGLSSVMFTTLAGVAFAIATRKHWQAHLELGARAQKRVGRLLTFGALGYAMHYPVRHVADFAQLSEVRWKSFLQTDVLQMIALTVIGLELLVVATRTPRRFAWVTLTLGSLVALLTPVMRLTDWQAHLPLPLAAFLYEGSGSNFPLFPWSGFALLGAGLGTLAVDWQARGLAHVARKLFVVGAGLLGLTFVWRLLPAATFQPSQVAEDNSDFLFLRLGIILVVLALLMLATRRLERLWRPIAVVGQQSLIIYFVHVIVLYGSIWGPGLRQLAGGKLGPLATLGAIVLLEGAMVLLALGWDTFKRRHPAHTGKAKWLFAALLAAPLI